MTDTVTTPSWLSRLTGLMDGSLETAIGPHDVITGAQWRDFYCNHWPKEFYIDDFRVDFEDERGAYILDDAAKHPLEAFGVAVWHAREDFGPFSSGVMINVHLLYAAIMEQEVAQLVTFKVAPEKLDALLAAAEAAGARRI